MQSKRLSFASRRFIPSWSRLMYIHIAVNHWSVFPLILNPNARRILKTTSSRLCMITCSTFYNNLFTRQKFQWLYLFLQLTKLRLHHKYISNLWINLSLLLLYNKIKPDKIQLTFFYIFQFSYNFFKFIPFRYSICEILLYSEKLQVSARILILVQLWFIYLLIWYFT